jgi:LuxR family maltose regulon positive regulatory protein
MELVLEKVTFPTAHPVMGRPRLLDVLAASLENCSVTIVNGRAGTGKTSLVLDFASRSERSVAWFKVDAPDAEHRLFFEYLIESVRRKRPAFGNFQLSELVKCATIEEMPLCAETFVLELLNCPGEPLLLILEDLHLVFDADWVVPFFNRLLPLLPRDVHLLITCRSLPPAPLWRMRSKQSLRLIDENALLFTFEEARALLEDLGLGTAEARVTFDESRGRAVWLVNMAYAILRSRNVPTRTRPAVSQAQVKVLNRYYLG